MRLVTPKYDGSVHKRNTQPYCRVLILATSFRIPLTSWTPVSRAQASFPLGMYLYCNTVNKRLNACLNGAAS